MFKHFKFIVSARPYCEGEAEFPSFEAEGFSPSGASMGGAAGFGALEAEAATGYKPFVGSQAGATFGELEATAGEIGLEHKAFADAAFGIMLATGAARVTITASGEASFGELTGSGSLLQINPAAAQAAFRELEAEGAAGLRLGSAGSAAFGALAAQGAALEKLLSAGAATFGELAAAGGGIDVRLWLAGSSTFEELTASGASGTAFRSSASASFGVFQMEAEAILAHDGLGDASFPEMEAAASLEAGPVLEAQVSFGEMTASGGGISIQVPLEGSATFEELAAAGTAVRVLPANPSTASALFGELMATASANILTHMQGDADFPAMIAEALADRTEWSPAALFQSGEQGGAWDFTDASTMTVATTGTGAAPAIGDDVGYVNDVSGNGADIAAYSNGTRGVLIDAGLDFQGSSLYLLSGLTISGYTGPQDVTFAFAGEYSGSPSETNGFMILRRNGVTANHEIRSRGEFAGGDIQFGSQANGGGYSNTNMLAGMPTSTGIPFRAILTQHNAGNNSGWRSGWLDGSKIDDEVAFSNAGNTIDANIDQLQIGARRSGTFTPDTYFTGSMKRALFIDRELTDLEILQVDGWLNPIDDSLMGVASFGEMIAAALADYTPVAPVDNAGSASFDPLAASGAASLVSFQISDLFANGEQGGAWDFSNTAAMRISRAGTGAAPSAQGDLVGWIPDLSGNGNPLVAWSDAWRGKVFSDADGGIEFNRTACYKADNAFSISAFEGHEVTMAFSAAYLGSPSDLNRFIVLRKASQSGAHEASISGLYSSSSLRGYTRTFGTNAIQVLAAGDVPASGLFRVQYLEKMTNGDGTKSAWINGVQTDADVPFDCETSTEVLFDQIQIGARFNLTYTPTDGLNGMMARVLFIDRELTAGEKILVDGWLNYAQGEVEGGGSASASFPAMAASGAADAEESIPGGTDRIAALGDPNESPGFYAIANPVTNHQTNSDGVTAQSVYSCNSAVANGIGAMLGHAPSITAALKQINWSFDSILRNPMMTCGYYQNVDTLILACCLFVRENPDAWSQLSNQVKNRINAAFKVQVKSSSYTMSDINDWGTNPRTVRGWPGGGGSNQRSTAPNQSLSGIAAWLLAYAWFGSAEAMRAVMATSCASISAELLGPLCGLTTASPMWRTLNWASVGNTTQRALGSDYSRYAPTPGQIDAATDPDDWTWFGYVVEDYHRIMAMMIVERDQPWNSDHKRQPWAANGFYGVEYPAGGAVPVGRKVEIGIGWGRDGLGPDPDGANQAQGAQPVASGAVNGVMVAGKPLPPGYGLEGAPTEMFCWQDEGKRSALHYVIEMMRPIVAAVGAGFVRSVMNPRHSEILNILPRFNRAVLVTEHMNTVGFHEYTHAGKNTALWPTNTPWQRNAVVGDENGAPGGNLYATWTKVFGPALGCGQVLKNGSFANSSNWSGLGSGKSISSGRLQFSGVAAGAGVSQAIPLIPDKYYQVEYTLLNDVSGSARVSFIGGTQVNGVTRSANGNYRERIKAGPSSTALFINAVTTATMDFDSVTVTGPFETATLDGN